MSSNSIKLKGVNLSGAEYNVNKISARYGTDYIYPSTTEIDYYKRKNFTTIRLPFSGSRLQPTLNGSLNTAEVDRIRSTINYAASKGMYVILDPHEYGGRFDPTSNTYKLFGVSGGLPASVFADFWRRVANEFKSHPNVIFGLMNEPNKQTPAQWKAVAVQAFSAVRATGAKQLILVQGAYWDGAHSWVSSGNAAAWTGFTDPANNFAFEVHQYLDSDSSGTHSSCLSNRGGTVLSSISSWARTNRYKLFLGEMGWANNSTCLTEGAAMVNYMTRNADVWTGWTYWSGGRWIPQSYMFMLTPSDFNTDKPQMKALTSNL